MPNPGTINGSHHLTFCVGGAQEDYDFHVRTLGLKSVKKTVLFDGEIPIYHLYYANRVGDASTILTGSPTARRGGWASAGPTRRSRSTSPCPRSRSATGRTGSRGAGVEAKQVERFGTERLEFSHPCGIPYQIVGETREDTREPYGGGDVPAEHAIRGAWGTTISVREPELMDEFLREAFNCEHVASEGAHHQYEIRATATAACSSWSRSPTCRRARGASARARSTTTRSTSARPRTSSRVKDYIVGLGYTDVSDVKDRGYFFSVYLRTPGGALFELAFSTPQGFTIDEPEDELGTHMCIPPHWEDRRSEISQLEPIDTIEDVKD